MLSFSYFNEYLEELKPTRYITFRVQLGDNDEYLDTSHHSALIYMSLPTSRPDSIGNFNFHVCDDSQDRSEER